MRCKNPYTPRLGGWVSTALYAKRTTKKAA